MADSDTVSASVVTVGEGQVGALDELVELAGSDEFEACLQQIFETPASFPESADAPPAETYPTPELEIAAESDIGVGDTSARLRLTISSTFGDEVYVSNSFSAMARAGRSLVVVTLNSLTAEPLADVDVDADLSALVDAL